MKKCKLSFFGLKRLTAFVLCMVMMTALALPLKVNASKDTTKVVRVGWYESPVSYIDENGRRTGYDYVYEQKLASYTGWTYEYVKGSWPELFVKLQNGEIDMLGDVSYTEERAEYLLYPTLPMGTEDYYIFTVPQNTELTQGSISAFKGRKIGLQSSRSTAPKPDFTVFCPFLTQNARRNLSCPGRQKRFL
ncbi:MAG: transporter substrate-binding domain-containing protein [Clostridia bacterium]|nr:transporter substrate-binding domain-containing protein [Clostridia bacterium]